MKRQRLTFFLTILTLSGLLQVSAQAPIQPLPIDPKVKYGKLDNGLTYYIRHNELPKERAEFFIVQNVGSVLEDDNQAGLAHFLEHMAFNGTKNLPEKTMINYLESVGVKFGENLNAYTGFDQTVYNISNVPTLREGLIDTCMLVLHDWSGFITLGDKEIEKERGVIREEMRTRNNAGYRQMESLFPQIMPGSQYAKRMPIGTEEVIMNFKPQELKDYYHKWYRPDLQAVIIIGDIDVEQIESKLKTLFADIPKPVNPAERIYYPVPDNDEPLVGIVTDKEATNTRISIYYKHDPLPDDQLASVVGLVGNYIKGTISMMMNDRFSEIVQKANPPFVGAGAMDGNFIVAKTKDAFLAVCSAKENEIEGALTALTQEVERVRKFGFTASEYDRARVNILQAYEKAYNERDKQRNQSYTREYVDHFTDGGYIPGIEVEYNMLSQIAPQFPVEQINKYIQEIIGDKNIVLSITGPEKEGFTYPSKEQVLEWFDAAKKSDIKPYEDNVSNEPLLTTLPKPGKVKSNIKEDKFGATGYVLSNGVKVYFKPTNFKDDEIQMSATSPGGSSLFPEDQLANIKLYSSIVDLGGLGNFSAVDLKKVLAGKIASAGPTINLVSEGMSGSSSIRDFETMLQLVYLYFTAPRMDEDAYSSLVERYKSQLITSEVNPSNTLIDSINFSLYNSPERTNRLRAEDMDKVNYQTIMNWYKDRYKDASDFTFTFVGNIDPVKEKPLIEQYLGSLPSINRKESFKNIDASYKEGVQNRAFDKVMENPTASVVDIYTGTIDPTLDNRMKLSMLTQILRIVYTEKVREEESGTYGVSVSGRIADYPKGQCIVQMYFDTNEEKKEHLNNIVRSEFANIAKNGPQETDFSKVKEFMLKKFNENQQENSYWLGTINSYFQTGYDGHSNYENILNKITPADIKTFAKSLIDQNNSIEIIMNGVKAQ